ncbi:hypothetical protein Cgig2_001579 [Carnegiea gigantea]|uniref:Endonuclease/exonuclease/phosphatase domain-containing protein n=1 Tax=Carnegiea gigantea TaxID=171969 RepID=A0A9Q1JVP4_9CARY|nr:hypothetical protein Cgig2_001579 [Carnegiea gigantea]
MIEMKNLLPELGNFSGIFVDTKGRSGGLGLLWDKEMKVQFLSCSLHHIDITVQWVDDEVPWRFSGIYGWLEGSKKRKMGELISDLSNHSVLPWLIGGDLNEIFFHCEKRGGPPNLKPPLIASRALLSTMGFATLDIWNGVMVEERLDCYCANTDWSLYFTNAHVTDLDSDKSDHLPILLKCNPSSKAPSRRFHFENMWFTTHHVRRLWPLLALRPHSLILSMISWRRLQTVHVISPHGTAPPLVKQVMKLKKLETQLRLDTNAISRASPLMRYGNGGKRGNTLVAKSSL